MLMRKMKDGARAVAESAGILAPTLADAQTTAEDRRKQLVDAQAQAQQAEAALEAAYDRGASPRDIAEVEARLADARLTAERSQRAYAAAEKRLAQAREAEAGTVKAEAVKARDIALAIRAQVAARIDTLAAEIAEQVSIYDAQDGPLSEAAAAGVASWTFRIDGAGLAHNALERAGAFPSHWMGGKATQPSAVELAAQQADATLAGA